MKMTFNEILECANKVLDTERKKNGIEARGHFVGFTGIKKLMGNYREVCIDVNYVNGDRTYAVSRIRHTYQGEVKEEECMKEAIYQFFMLLRFGMGPLAYDKFVNGTYVGVE